MSQNTKTFKAATDPVLDPEAIKAIKDVEKEKLAAAEKSYGKRMDSRSAPLPVEQSDEGECAPFGGHGMPWIPAVILIGMGTMFLLRNLTGFELHNWWALFLFIPAFGAFSRAFQARSAGMRREAWGAMAGGLIFTLVASAFLFDLDWGNVWPVFLIIGGAGMVLGSLRSG